MSDNAGIDLAENPDVALKHPATLRRIVSVGIILVFILVITIFHRQILWALGAMLVNAGPPRPADIAITMAGDQSGFRVLKGAELVRQGYVPKVLVSGAGR